MHFYGFKTNNIERAKAAAIIYSVYRSRDTKRFKTSVKMWEQIANFSKLASKKSANLAEFTERLCKPLCCGAIQSRYAPENGVIECDGSAKVLLCIYKETAFVILLVRQKLEEEKNAD